MMQLREGDREGSGRGKMTGRRRRQKGRGRRWRWGWRRRGRRSCSSPAWGRPWRGCPFRQSPRSETAPQWRASPGRGIPMIISPSSPSQSLLFCFSFFVLCPLLCFAYTIVCIYNKWYTNAGQDCRFLRRPLSSRWILSTCAHKYSVGSTTQDLSRQDCWIKLFKSRNLW